MSEYSVFFKGPFYLKKLSKGTLRKLKVRSILTTLYDYMEHFQRGYTSCKLFHIWTLIFSWKRIPNNKYIFGFMFMFMGRCCMLVYMYEPRQPCLYFYRVYIRHLSLPKSLNISYENKFSRLILTITPFEEIIVLKLTENENNKQIKQTNREKKIRRKDGDEFLQYSWLQFSGDVWGFLPYFVLN